MNLCNVRGGRGVKMEAEEMGASEVGRKEEDNIVNKKIRFFEGHIEGRIQKRKNRGR